MSTTLKIVIVFAFLHSFSAQAILRSCHTWLLEAPLAITDVGSEYTLVVNQQGVLEFRDLVSGEPLRVPIALGPEILRQRFHPVAAAFSSDGAVVTLEYAGLGLHSYDTSSGITVPDPSL